MLCGSGSVVLRGPVVLRSGSLLRSQVLQDPLPPPPLPPRLQAELLRSDLLRCGSLVLRSGCSHLRSCPLVRRGSVVLRSGSLLRSQVLQEPLPPPLPPLLQAEVLRSDLLRSGPVVLRSGSLLRSQVLQEPLPPPPLPPRLWFELLRPQLWLRCPGLCGSGRSELRCPQLRWLSSAEPAAARLTVV